MFKSISRFVLMLHLAHTLTAAEALHIYKAETNLITTLSKECWVKYSDVETIVENVALLYNKKLKAKHMNGLLEEYTKILKREKYRNYLAHYTALASAARGIVGEDTYALTPHFYSRVYNSCYRLKLAEFLEVEEHILSGQDFMRETLTELKCSSPDNQAVIKESYKNLKNYYYFLRTSTLMIAVQRFSKAKIRKKIQSLFSILAKKVNVSDKGREGLFLAVFSLVSQPGVEEEMLSDCHEERKRLSQEKSTTPKRMAPKDFNGGFLLSLIQHYHYLIESLEISLLEKKELLQDIKDYFED